VIKLADWIIDLGPEGGVGGGQLVAMGRPEDIVHVEESYTGRWLEPLLNRKVERESITPRLRTDFADFEPIPTQLAL
jgi:excinuclease ABC subunit A